jgi:prepilin-type N-terminal cleavage/methylation domain-containing protein
MFINRTKRKKGGFTLMEFMVASGLFGIAGAALCTVYVFSAKGFLALADYAELDKINRNAMDTLTREIRQARQVVDVQANSITVINGEDHSITYNFDPTIQKLVRYDSTDGSTRTLVSSCSLLNFDVYQRNPVDGTFDQYPVATTNWSSTVKVIRLTWKASRQVPLGAGVSENIQTARIVIRKQH